jgi:alpha-tubulin suppressor-like RCC1 family protein
VLGLASCRLYFEDRPAIGDASGDGADDASELGSCSTDEDCGRCQRCEVGRCERAMFSQIQLGIIAGCALDERGEVWCWGRNTYYVVDSTAGYDDVISRPRRRRELTGLQSLAAGRGLLVGHTLAGGITGRGYADGDLNDTRPIWQRVFAHWFNGCALESGRLHCFGENGEGQLARGMTSGGVAPIEQVGTDSDWRTVAPGPTMCAVKLDGRLFCVGQNDHGELGRGTTSARELALQQVGTDSDWSDVSTTEHHVCARKTDGSLWCWGGNLITGAPISTPTRVGSESDWTWSAVNYRCACGLRGGTALYCRCGSSDVSQAIIGVQDTNWTLMPIAVDQGTQPALGGHAACVRSQGAWQCWGRNSSGEVGVGSSPTHVPPTPLCE